MTLKRDQKFKGELTCSFKHDMKLFLNFHPTNQDSENFTSIDWFCSKYLRFELKNTEELSFMRPNSDAKFE